MQIQEYITAAIQNIETLMRYGKDGGAALAMENRTCKKESLFASYTIVKYRDGLIFGKENILIQHCYAVN